MRSDTIIIRGARQHNLKNIDLELPKNSLVVITGLSGSGKSSLAFDTLYAEGQRRYVESLSTYARQFLGKMDKPDVDLIEGLSPAIAIEQKTASHNPRSTVGTVTEIYDYMRLLFARCGLPHCYKCGTPITSQSIDQIVDSVMAIGTGAAITILAPVVTNQKGSHEKLLSSLRKEGFARVRVDGIMTDIEEVKKLAKNRKHTIEVVADRLRIRDGISGRLTESIELAMSKSDGLVIVEVMDADKKSTTQTMLFSERAACTRCGISYPEFTPASFSFNSPQGACPKCDGLGSVTELDPDLIIPDPDLSLRNGAVAVWANRNSLRFIEFLEALTSSYGVDIYTPYRDLPESFKRVLLYGSGDREIPFYFERRGRRITYKKPFEGIIPNLQRRYLETDSASARDDIKQYMNFRTCDECNGTRLNRASSSVTVGEMTIAQITALSIRQARSFFTSLSLSGKQRVIAAPVLKEICDRLSFLEDVGLSYLTLDRSAASLSGGESQRIRLATQIGSKLTGVLYVLDEPSIGLHQKDNQRLLSSLLKMRDLGNTVLVVEHDRETIMRADHVVDMGPGAGAMGGEVVFSGTPEKLLKDEKSVTGRYFSGRESIPTPETRRTAGGRCLRLTGASQNNLKNIDVEFPLGCITCVTGVSGSGKSTLVLDTLYRALAQKLYRAKLKAGKHISISGIEYIDKVIHIDQSPIGRTPRSNPATYTGVFTFIRELFSKTPDARARGYAPGRFSFNVKGGRCEACDGDGIIKIEMHFLPDVFVACDVCKGKRYNRETLEVRYRGKNIADVLDMTVNQALAFFKNVPAINSKLTTLVDVGLGYIHLGQPATTLSGGEAQRIKLSRELGKRSTGKTVYFMDEPTTGLHVHDIKCLLGVLDRLVDAGNTVIIIEHNLDVIKHSDYIIDLGPEGGDNGGRIVGCGTPEQLAKNPDSHTGYWLRTCL